ncbi:MAG: hypothetical protein JWN76_3695 [Chitinophagaceae bacterium]|nr:hypothetical protein [Chitinophagaceae bacterium]
MIQSFVMTFGKTKIMKNLLFILFIFLAVSACKKSAGPTSKTLKDLLPGKWNWDSALTTTDKSGSINIIKGDVQPGAYWQFDLNGTVLYTAVSTQLEKDTIRFYFSK